MQGVPSWDQPSAEVFLRDIAPLEQPALMRGVASDWPLVALAKQGDERCIAEMKHLASAEPIAVVRAEAFHEGRFHYSDDMRALNFTRGKSTLSDFLSILEQEARSDDPCALSAQGVLARQVVPDFAARHPMPYAPEGAEPRLWIGNAAKVATHNDPLSNIAVVVAGRRRFTLFAPDQIGNLYLGPLHFTPAGTPISMVHVTKPDLDRYPRYADALASAWFAELESGDALYIPYAWYHHVEATERFNMLVNYWWNDAPTDAGSPWDAMLHGMMSLRGLPEHQRQAWQAMFDHYVFLANGDPGAHLPEHVRGIMAATSARDAVLMRNELLRKLGAGQ